MLHIDKYDEDYLIPLPDIRARGWLSGVPYPELIGTYHIVSSTGYISEITFSGQGLFYGQRNGFTATVYHSKDVKKSPIYTVAGQWSHRFTFHDSINNVDLETYDVNSVPAGSFELPDVVDQDSWESRKAWGGVIDALNRGDMQSTIAEKSKVEEAQRALRQAEIEQGIEWQPAFFSSMKEEDPLFGKLAAVIGQKLDADKTKGVWKFNKAKARVAARPYHGTLTPFG